ncbi:MAG: hypothetical protein ABI318_17435 [Chthoniobacteraceae bacterium]
MSGKFLMLALVLIAMAGRAAPPDRTPRASRPFPADALVTQRAVLTVRGRQFTLNGYLALSATGGKRLIVTENFGAVLADVLVKRDGTVQVIRSSRVFSPAWIQRYVVADMQCIFGGMHDTACPVRMLSATHFVIERRWYKLDLQIVGIKPGRQKPGMFDGTNRVAS